MDVPHNQTSSLNFVKVSFEATQSEIDTEYKRKKGWKLNFVHDIEVRLEYVDRTNDYRVYLHLLQNPKCLHTKFYYEICFLDGYGQEHCKINHSTSLYFPEESKEIARWERFQVANSVNTNNLYYQYSAVRFTLSVEPFIGPPQQIEVLETLSEDFVNYLDNQMNTDCVLKTGCDPCTTNHPRIPVHRAVLCARSKVFAAMFRDAAAQNSSGQIDILNVDETTLKDVVYYIYSGKVRNLTSDTAVAIYEAADLYDLPGLKDICLDFLLKSLTVLNNCETEILRFIRAKFEVITKSDVWKQFSQEKPSLVTKILCAILLNKKLDISPSKFNYTKDNFKIGTPSYSSEEKNDDDDEDENNYSEEDSSFSDYDF